MLSKLVIFLLSFHSHFFLKIIIFYGIRLRHISQLHKSYRLKLYSVAESIIHKSIVCFSVFFSYNYHRSAFCSNCMHDKISPDKQIFFCHCKFMMNTDNFRDIQRKILSCYVRDIILISAHLDGSWLTQKYN